MYDIYFYLTTYILYLLNKLNISNMFLDNSKKKKKIGKIYSYKYS